MKEPVSQTSGGTSKVELESKEILLDLFFWVMEIVSFFLVTRGNSDDLVLLMISLARPTVLS